jgi:hypothetical protein
VINIITSLCRSVIIKLAISICENTSAVDEYSPSLQKRGAQLKHTRRECEILVIIRMDCSAVTPIGYISEGIIG